ncbi:hypothetical protein Clacol_008192 [Clathrus columnatus]|uniref:Uncharacterized protein n=1 Tax=Clathrus columnatus TaxID=1419009 RepID=A0AAV5AHT2_9AGAM|nr:hypothetical protein Clacol_008192 [Clathrus columnatus]
MSMEKGRVKYSSDILGSATHGVRLWDSLRTWCKIIDEQEIKRAFNLFEKEEADRFEEGVIEGGVVALPGVHNLLDALRAGSTPDKPGWTIVTSATNFYAPRALAQAGIEVSQYNPIITANDVSKGKPHADPYLAGAKSLNIDPKNCLVVEDAINGILSGKAAGAKTLGVTTSSSKEVVAVAKPDWIVQDLSCVSVCWIDGKLEVTILEDE